ncbi:MAG: hypothetical protein QW633_03805 [Candidatus Aenigmatarchaeota archaeon]
MVEEDLDAYNYLEENLTEEEIVEREVEEKRIRSKEEALKELIYPEPSDISEREVINKDARTANLFREEWFRVAVALGSFTKDMKIIFGENSNTFKEACNDYKLLLNLSSSHQAKIIESVSGIKIERKFSVFEDKVHKK